jgi:hypothetical protein
MRDYICLYRGKEIAVQASSSYEAQQKAQARFRCKKAYEITVLLADSIIDTSTI